MIVVLQWKRDGNMKHRIFTLLLALVMIFGASTVALADDASVPSDDAADKSAALPADGTVGGANGDLAPITTEAALVEALHNAEDGATILVGDIDFAYASPMGMTLSKSVTIKSGLEGRAVFSGGAFAVMGGAAEQDTLSIRFENIWFKGVNDIANNDFANLNIMTDTKIKPAMFFSRCVDASFTGCDFTGYSMANGGAVYGIYSSEDSKAFRLSLDFENCTLNENAGGYGGAIYLAGADNIFLSMRNCTLNGNVAAYGGAIFADGASVTLANCEISGNRFVDFFPTTDVKGGGIYAANSMLELTNCRITDNSARRGGGLALAYTESVVDGCIISGNTAVADGGALWVENSGNNLVTVMNSTVAANAAAECGAVSIVESDAVLGGGGIGRTYMHLCTAADNTPASPVYAERLSLFGCALYGEGRGEAVPSDENDWCSFTEAAHGGDPYTHLRGSEPIDRAALDSVANGRFVNRVGAFLAGDNARESIPVTLMLGDETRSLELPYGETLELDSPERGGYVFDGWYLPDGSPFDGDDLFVGTDALALVAHWTPLAPSPEPSAEPTVEPLPELGSGGRGAVIVGITSAVAVLALAVVAVSLALQRRRAAVVRSGEEGGSVETPVAVSAKSSALSGDAVECILAKWEDASLLTERERDVVKLLLEGKQRKDIAAALFITEHTVKDHVSNSYRKLGVKNRTELLARANDFK